MKITIDNQDGLGALDYTGCLGAGKSLQLHRQLNAQSTCILQLDCNGGKRVVPSQYGHVVLTSDAGTTLFTGYVALPPAAKLVGEGATGTLYTYDVTVVSDELLLNQQGVPVTAGSTGMPMQTLLQSLTQRVDPARITVEPADTIRNVGTFVPDAGKDWASNAGLLVAMARSSYRVLNQQLSVAPIAATTHALSETGGTLNLSKFSIAQTKTLANDMTVCGESEPQAYVTDMFQGDGTTTTFELTHKPMRISGVKGQLVSDNFGGPALNQILWSVSDPGSRLSLGAGGLAVNGGNGVDGQTTLSTIDNIEMGGSLVLTTGGVQVDAGSDGYVGCFYSGSVLPQNLFAGFHVKQSAGSTVVVPVINSVETGVSAVLVSGHVYSFRLRYACSELQRVFAGYYVAGEVGEQVFGGGTVAAPGQLVFEVQETTGGINGAALVLYDGPVTVTPTTCFLCAINSPAFTGSLQSVDLQQSGTGWVQSVETNGSTITRRIGLATEGADCKLESTGKLVFYATGVPQAGETVALTYRTTGKAVARLQNAGSVANQATAVVPGVSRWVGSVTHPPARSSADCENAALALLQLATDPTAALTGTYEATNLQQAGDVWPGDALALESPSLNLNAAVIVKAVMVTNTNAEPEVLNYSIAFANEWAEAIGVKLSSSVPKDVWLPPVAVAAPASLANLATLSTTVNATQIAVNAGQAAPAGGGFEVRRVDWNFGAGNDGTLVLRSPVANFSIPRETAVEQYYVRMYDASSPPKYSRFSNAICVSVPL